MIADTAAALRQNIQKVIVGKDEVIDLAMIALLTLLGLALQFDPGSDRR